MVLFLKNLRFIFSLNPLHLVSNLREYFMVQGKHLFMAQSKNLFMTQGKMFFMTQGKIFSWLKVKFFHGSR